MQQPRRNNLQRLLDNQESLVTKKMQKGTNLVYFASGSHIAPEYGELSYDNIILVDKCFKDAIHVSNKVMCLGLTALEATFYFKSISLKIDAFVCINEGLFEGGGYYPINGNWSLGMILPLLKEEYIHISCPFYYGDRRWKRNFNLPHQATLLSREDAQYIDPSIFSPYYGVKSQVWHIKKQPGPLKSFLVGNRKVIVQRQSIWQDYEQLDQIFIRCTPDEEYNISSLIDKVSFINDFTQEQLLRYCTKHKIRKIGLTPWLGGHYGGFIHLLAQSQEKYPFPEEIHFYHLNKNDYADLYKMADNEPNGGRYTMLL